MVCVGSGRNVKAKGEFGGSRMYVERESVAPNSTFGLGTLS